MSGRSPVAAEPERLSITSVQNSTQIRLPCGALDANNFSMNIVSKNIVIWWWGSFTRP